MTSKKAILELLECKLAICIYYLVHFEEEPVQALIDSSSEVNTINPTFAKKLGFWVWKTKVKAQIINNSTVKTFEMVISSFLINDKIKNSQFFEETFFLADININIALSMFFLTLSKVEINFFEWEFNWRSYTLLKLSQLLSGLN